MPRPGYVAGIDWSTTEHRVAVLDHAGEVVAEDRLSDDADGVARLAVLLGQVAGRRRRQVPVAIESGCGLFVQGLRDAGHRVVVLNPMLVARYRSRLSTTRRKSDRGDARLLAHILRVDGASHRPLPQISPLGLAIREIARAQHQAVQDRKRQQIRLDAMLRTYFPAMRAACGGLPGGLCGPAGRALVAAAPTPGQAALLTRQRLADMLQQAGRRAQFVAADADRLHQLFTGSGGLRQPPPVEEAMGHRVLAQSRLLAAAQFNAVQLAEQLDVLIGQHPQAPIYQSFPGLGPLLAGRLLGELGDDPGRFADARAVRAFSGATPVTWASGSMNVVRRRRNTSPLLVTTCHLWAWAALQPSPGARAHYDRRRAAGDRHATALRHLSARLLGQLHHCLAHNLDYDEQRAYPTDQ